MGFYDRRGGGEEPADEVGQRRELWVQIGEDVEDVV